MQHSVNMAFWTKKDILACFNTDRVVFVAAVC